MLGAGGHDRAGGRSATSPSRRRWPRCGCWTSTRGERRPPPASTAGAVRRRERPTPAPGWKRSSSGCDVLVNCASYRVNLDAMRACLEAGCHYIDLGGLYWLTGRQLELHDEFERAGLLALLGMGSSPGKTNVMAVARGPPAPGPGRAARRDGRRARPRPAGRARPIPYALQTLVDELTLRPVVVRGRGAGRRSSRSATAGAVDFGEPIGPRRHDPHASLRAAHVPATASAAGRRASASRWRRRCSSGCASWLRRRPSASRPPPRRPLPPPPAPSRCTSSTLTAGGRRVRVRAVTEPVARVGARRRGRLDRCSRQPQRCGCWRGAGSRRAARSRPSAASSPRTCSRSWSAAVPVSRSTVEHRSVRGVKVGVPTEIKPTSTASRSRRPACASCASTATRC